MILSLDPNDNYDLINSPGLQKDVAINPVFFYYRADGRGSLYGSSSKSDTSSRILCMLQQELMDVLFS